LAFGKIANDTHSWNLGSHVVCCY